MIETPELFRAPRGASLTLALLLAAAVVTALVFWRTGVYNHRIDAWVYIAQIESLQEQEIVSDDGRAAFRAFKPFYAVVGAALGPFLSPASAIVFLNVLFLAGLALCSFSMLRALSFDAHDAFIGACWISTGYPVLKYGLAISTDMGGWFFAVLTVLLVLRAKDSTAGLIIASVVGFIGSTVKETGVLGLIFGGLYLVLRKDRTQWRSTVRSLAALALPALGLQILFIWFLSLHGAPSFLDWYGKQSFPKRSLRFGKLVTLVGTEGAAFHLLWLLSLIGVLELWRRHATRSLEVRAALIGLTAASLPVLLWPTFISRILYIQFLIIVPLALCGLIAIRDRVPASRRLLTTNVLAFLPVLTSVILFLLVGTGTFFRRF